MNDPDIAEMNQAINNINQARMQFGITLICWDCKKPLPEEKDQYQHSNLWPLCKGCAERREEIKLQILRNMARGIRNG